MKTAECPDRLQTLEAQLQSVLQQETALQPPIQIRCGSKQGALLVLAEHPIALPNPRHIFALSEQTIHALPPAAIQAFVSPENSSEQTLPVRLYLRVLGQAQPYASHLFIAASEQMPTPPAVPAAESPIDSGRDIVPVIPAAIVAETAETSALTVLESDGLTEMQPDRVWWQLPASLWGLAAAIGLSAFAASLYTLTRPCVLTACVPLQTAQQLQRQAAQTIQSTNSPQAVLQAYEQLNEASYLLSTIPAWSKHHDAAQTQLQNAEEQTQGLRQVVAALRQAQAAAQASQNPPHPFTRWQEIRQQWQQAIVMLELISAESPVYGLAQRKLGEYQSNLAAIGQRMAIERQAQQQVNTARSTAHIAEAREGVAASLDSWQLTYATWQTVVGVLKQVPQSTMAHAEAQQLLAIYQPKLSAVRDRHKQEEISANAYNQAVSFATQARAFEQRRQWSQAVEQWRDALTQAQQVPNNTLYYAQAQPLINAYTAALSQAQDTLSTTTAMQSAAADLSRICEGSPTICSYSFAETAIQVRITAAYDRAVEQAMTRTQMTGDYVAQAEVTAHVNTLLRALAAISENAEVPIELYNSDGSLFGTYVPAFSGYVAR